MKIKGTAVRTLPKYIKKYFPDKYGQWLGRLPAESQKYFKQLYPSHWYDLHLGAVLPTRVFADLIGQDKEKVAFDVGKFSADDAFRGVYKVFSSITSASFYIRKAETIVGTYYNPVEVKVNEFAKRNVELYIGRVEPRDVLIFYRIEGWVAELVQLTQKTDADIDLELIRDSEGLVTVKYSIKW